MATFTVNGQTVQAEKNQKLIRFLQEECCANSNAQD